MTPRLTAHEVLERLHTTRQILTAVQGCRRAPREPPWRSAGDVLAAIAALEQYALRRLHRADVAEYAADVQQYAKHVLGGLLMAAPAREV